MRISDWISDVCSSDLLGRASQVNVFVEDKRDIAAGDRIQWRLATRELGLKNAERGTIERLDGTIATIRWNRGVQPPKIDLSVRSEERRVGTEGVSTCRIWWLQHY